MFCELLEENGRIQWPCNKEKALGIKRLYSPDIAFRTKDEKAKFVCVDSFPMAESVSKKYVSILRCRFR